MIISKDTPPLLDKMNPSVQSFERGLDPWHKDAFPDEHKHAGTPGDRKEGWFCLDWAGNAIGFIPDGEWDGKGDGSKIIVKRG